MGGGKGSGRILVGALIGVVLVAAVGLASRARTPAGGGHTRSISEDIFLEYVLLLLVALAVVIVPVAVYLFVAGRGEDEPALPQRKNWMVPLFFSMIALSVVAVLLLRYVHDHHGDNSNPASRLIGLAKHGTRATGAVGFDWGPVIVVSSLAVVALVAGAWLVHEHRRTEPRRTHVAAELAVLLERTIADLRAEPDPRTAVIAAYAQMEVALADVGLRRRADEAPREYLGRVLPEVGAQTASVERLTRLFERAKFSPHAIDAAMKDEAIDALESLRDDLRSAL
jgi:NADH:ubiquinone oxidoreductase subunit 6 (subunit J)